MNVLILLVYSARRRRAVCWWQNRRLWPFVLAFALVAANEPATSFWYGQTADDVTAFRQVTDFHLKAVFPDRSFLHQVSARMTPVHPTNDKNAAAKDAFMNDWQLVQKTESLAGRQPAAFSAQSAEYRWHVERPGKDVLYIKPRKELFLPDRNRIFSFYARGAQHAHQIFALFRGPNRLQQEIFICSLDFSGWKRFEVVIPPYLRSRNPLKQNRFELYFQGLKVQSHFRDQPGMSVFNLAQMLIMADTSDKKIPGADMPAEF
jgi:hypothetical protein